MPVFAVIENATNICKNTVVWDGGFGPWTPPSDHYTVDIDGVEVGIGWTHDPATGVFTAPPAPPPPPVLLSSGPTKL